MKKIAKIIAAMTVAVAAFALVGCADGMSEDIEKAYTPETPAAAPAEREVGTVYNYILDYDSTNADFNFTWMANPGALQAKVSNLGTTEKPNKVTEYAIDGGSFHSAAYWEARDGQIITDSNTTIDVEDVFTGKKVTYKLFDATKDLIPAGTYNLKSFTTIVNGVSTAITSADTTAWAALSSDVKEATVAANGAITWDGDTWASQVAAAEAHCSVTVSGETVTVAYPGLDEYTTYVYSFTKAAAADSGSGSGGSGSGGSGSGGDAVTISIPAGTYVLQSVTMAIPGQEPTTTNRGEDGFDTMADGYDPIVVTATSITVGLGSDSEAVYDEQATIDSFEEDATVSGNTLTWASSPMTLVYTKQ